VTGMMVRPLSSHESTGKNFMRDSGGA